MLKIRLMPNEPKIKIHTFDIKKDKPSIYVKSEA